MVAGKNQRGWVKIGLSVRFAEALNLSSEPDPALPMWLQVEHRWTFWSVYLLDRLVSCTPQHKLAIQDTDCTLDLPQQLTGSQHADGHRKRVKLAFLHNMTNSAADIDQAGHLILVASALAFNVEIDALLAMGLDLDELSHVNSSTCSSSNWS